MAGIVTIEKTVAKKTLLEAVSLSPLYCSAKTPSKLAVGIATKMTHIRRMVLSAFKRISKIKAKVGASISFIKLK